MADIESVSKVVKETNLAEVLVSFANKIYSNIYKTSMITFTFRKSLKYYIQGIQTH